VRIEYQVFALVPKKNEPNVTFNSFFSIFNGLITYQHAAKKNYGGRCYHPPL